MRDIFNIILVALVLIFLAILIFIGMFIFYSILAIVVVTLLVSHGKAYFKEDHPGVSKALIYVPVLLAMLTTVGIMMPLVGLSVGFHIIHITRWFALPFILASIYYAFGLRRIGPDLVHPYCSGRIYVDQVRTAVRAVPSMWLAAKRSAPWMFSHWVGIIAGIVAAFFAIPMAIMLMLVSISMALLMAIAWGAMLALPMLILKLVFRRFRKVGTKTICPKCGTSHAMPDPGPWGLFGVNCTCGTRLSLWKAPFDGEQGEITPWFQRERNPGAQSMLALSLFAAICLTSLRGSLIPLGQMANVSNANPVTPAPIIPLVKHKQRPAQQSRQTKAANVREEPPVKEPFAVQEPTPNHSDKVAPTKASRSNDPFDVKE